MANNPEKKPLFLVGVVLMRVVSRAMTKPKYFSFSPNSFNYRGPYFKYRGEGLQILIRFGGVSCRLNVCMGDGSQILIRFGGLAGCRHCFKYYSICLSCL